MNVFKIEGEDFPPLIVEKISDFGDVEATISNFLCLPGEEEHLQPGYQITITVIEMTREELDVLEEWCV